MSTIETDRKSKKAFEALERVARLTPTPKDDAFMAGLKAARTGLRKFANWLRGHGYMIVATAFFYVVIMSSGCSTIVRFDNWLPEWVPCDPVTELIDEGPET